MNLEQWGWLAYYPQLHRFHTNGPNCLLTSFTVKLRYPSDSISAEVRYNDDVPSGFSDGSTGKPGGLVPQGDQFYYSVNSSDPIYTYYTFYATARPGLALPSVDFYWLVLSLRQPMVSAWAAGEPNYNESITVDKVYYRADNGETQRLNGRTGMVKMYGCCDAPSPSPSTSPFALPVASSFANGAPDVETVSIPTALTTSAQCAGNIIVGLSGNRIDLTYFIRLTGVSTTTNVTTVAYIVDMSTAALLGQVDVSAHMPTAANDTYTQVNASIPIRSSTLVASRSYWLPFCFSATSGEGSIGMGGVAASAGKTTVGLCSGGPSCKPDLQSGSLATVITSTSTTSGGGGGSGTNTVAIAAGVAVGLVLVGLVVCLVVYIAYKRTRNRSELLPPVAGRRSSVPYTLLEDELQRVPGDD